MSYSLPRLPIFEAIASHDPASTAVVHSLSGRTFAYGGLLPDVARFRARLLAAAGRDDIAGERVAFLVENSYDYVVTLLAIVGARAIAVPMAPGFPPPELQYIVDHSEALLLVSSAKFAAKARDVAALVAGGGGSGKGAEAAEANGETTKKGPILVEIEKHAGRGRRQAGKADEEDAFSADISEAVALDASLDAGPGGMMLYTSGTTNRPKGVLLPLAVLTAQCRSLVKAWRYAREDRLLHVLPLHHIHGTVNAVLTPLLAGSSVEFLFPFNADAVWRRFAAPFLTEADQDELKLLQAPHQNGNGVPAKDVAAAVAAAAVAVEREAEGPAAKKQKLEVVTNGAANGNGSHVNGSSTNGTNGTNGVNGGLHHLNGTSAPPPTPATALNGTAALLQHHLQNGCGAAAASANGNGASFSTDGTNTPTTPFPVASPMSPTPPTATSLNGGASTPVEQQQVTIASAANSNHHTTTATAPAPRPHPVTFFTVVPTVYNRLLATHRHLPAPIQRASRLAISPAHLRLCISGSAALPTPIKRAWQDLSGGNVLLERYGMTEVGMALSCGLDFADRVDGAVGWPLPNVQARLVDVDTGDVIPADEKDMQVVGGGGGGDDAGADAVMQGGPVGGADLDAPPPPSTKRERSGEIQLRGPTIFASYWRNPTATSAEFVAPSPDDGLGPWFKTGDVAVRRVVPSAGTGSSGGWARGPLYFIQGRRSADIIKSGGEKVSALEVERELLSLPQVAEAAVVAVPSGKWGSKVGAVLVLDGDWLAAQRQEAAEGEGARGGAGGRGGGLWTPMDMRRALRSRLVNYKIPQVMRVVDHIPRNAMGKINKKVLVKDVFAEDFSGDEGGP